MRRYLVVDDNHAFAENVAEILRDSGAEALVATDGAGALDALRTGRFDALITDMRMPEVDGAALIREARRTDPGLPAIVVSAWTQARELRAAEEVGLLAILPKPVPIEQLLELLGTARRDGLVALIDDDESLVENLTEALRRRGFSVMTARTLAESRALDGAPFAALVDLRLPDGPDGEVLEQLHDQFPSLPLLVITGDAAASVKAPSLGVFLKPFETGALLNKLEELHQRQP